MLPGAMLYFPPGKLNAASKIKQKSVPESGEGEVQSGNSEEGGKYKGGGGKYNAAATKHCKTKQNAISASEPCCT